MIVWQNKMFCECLVKRPYPQATRETQLSLSVLTLHIPVMCRAHASFRGMFNRELPTKTLLSSIAWVFIHSLSITQPLQLNPTINTGYKRLNKISIKFGTELKPTKHIVVNYNFTISPFGYSVTKPLKQTLDLNLSLGTWHNSLTPNLEAAKHLYVYNCNPKHLHTNKTFIKLITSWTQGTYMNK